MSLVLDRARRPDLTLIVPVVCLVALGLVMVFSSSASLAALRYQSETFFLKRHLVRVILGGIVLVILARTDYHLLRKVAPWALGGTLLLLGVLLAVGGAVRGANRWLSVATVTIQPTEIARVACVVYLAKLLDRKGERMASFKEGVLPAMLVLGLMAFLILLQPNLGSTIALLATGLVMLLLSGARRRHLALLVAAGIVVAALAVSHNAYMMERVQGWLARWGHGRADALGKNWQVSQSILALGSGGVLGAGPGHGLQKVFFLPDPHTDFIFAVIGEELGLWGTAGVLVLFSIIFL
ncbi:MAG TPA: FtsW/RodA/SpoVE family cell cycle protein, partial [Candidatus Limnocylindrales bacterium]|nr:FtsW/RodA/SpoVE family cell cycle protein [Candidatus Limnocylindrales bacterium]